MLQRQRFTNWHCLLIDDRSTDEGPSLVSELAARDPRFRALRLAGPKCSPGPAAARSFGLQKVTSPLVAFCDADDLWHPDKLLRQLAFQQEHQLDFSVSGYGRFHDGTSPVLKSWRCPPESLTYVQLVGGNPLPMLTILVRTELVRSGFPACSHEDFALWLTVFRSHPLLRYGCLPEGLAFYRLHSGNLTRQRRRMLSWADGVFRTHGLSRWKRFLALFRWITYQLQQLCNESSINTPSGQDLSQLMEQPPVRLR